MDTFAQTPSGPHLTEHLTVAVERVTFHSEQTVSASFVSKSRPTRTIVTVVGSGGYDHAWEYIESEGWWVTDQTHGMQFRRSTYASYRPAL